VKIARKKVWPDQGCLLGQPSPLFTPIVAIGTSKSPRFCGTVGFTNLAFEKEMCSLLLGKKLPGLPADSRKKQKKRTPAP